MINNRFNVVYHLLYTVRFIKVECLSGTLIKLFKNVGGKFNSEYLYIRQIIY